MIGTTLTFLEDELNRALRRGFGAPGDMAVLAPVATAEGGPPKGTENRLILTLVNIEREPVAANTAQRFREVEGVQIRVSPPLNLNLVVLVSANFEQSYADGFKVLNGAIAHFQANPVFTPETHAGLPDGLGRLTVEWREMTLEAIHNLWTVLGGRYLPSAVYLARMLIVDESLLGAEVAPITGIGLEGRPE